MTLGAPVTILGGLPVFAYVSFGVDPFTGEGEADVEAIHWLKRNGEPGKRLPDHIVDRAAKFDPYFCDLTARVSDYHSEERA